MKKVLLAPALILLIFSLRAQEISSIDRKKALNYLKTSHAELSKVVKGLSDEQLNYKPSETSWSIAECVEHITISEQNLMNMIRMSLEKDSDPSRRSEVAMSDEQLLGLITSRDQKVKTRKEFEPTKSFDGFDETLMEFTHRRKSSLKFVKTTDADLRNHYLEFPFGLIDSYQAVLFMSGHTNRHTDQIKEIIQSESYPQ